MSTRGLADRPAPHPIGMQRPKLMLSHQPCDAVLATPLAGLAKVQ